MDNDYTDIPISDKVSWNLSMPLLQQIGNQLQSSNLYFLNGKIEQAFFCLRVIRMRIIHSINTAERKKCSDAEKAFSRNPNNPVNEKVKYSTFKEKQYNMYDEYNTIIMDLLEKYGYTIKKQEDHTSIN